MSSHLGMPIDLVVTNRLKRREAKSGLCSQPSLAVLLPANLSASRGHAGTGDRAFKVKL